MSDRPPWDRVRQAYRSDRPLASGRSDQSTVSDRCRPVCSTGKRRSNRCAMSDRPPWDRVRQAYRSDRPLASGRSDQSTVSDRCRPVCSTGKRRSNRCAMSDRPPWDRVRQAYRSDRPLASGRSRRLDDQSTVSRRWKRIIHPEGSAPSEGRNHQEYTSSGALSQVYLAWGSRPPTGADPYAQRGSDAPTGAPWAIARRETAWDKRTVRGEIIRLPVPTRMLNGEATLQPVRHERSTGADPYAQRGSDAPTGAPWAIARRETAGLPVRLSPADRCRPVCSTRTGAPWAIARREGDNR